MKKLSFVVSALGGAVLGYLASNKKLRDELCAAKNTETLGKTFARHLQQDGQRIGYELKAILESKKMQQKIRSARSLVQHQFQKAERGMQNLLEGGTAGMKEFTQKTLSSAKRSMKRTGKTTRKKLEV